MKKPIIGIVCSKIVKKEDPFLGENRSYISFDYVRAVEEAGGVPILLPLTINQESIDEFLEVCDGFVFSGGPDIHPLHYGEEPRIGLNKVFKDLDEFQIMLLKRVIGADMPILGICRGFQLMNIVMGGKLFQDLAEQDIKKKHYMDCDKNILGHKVIAKKDSLLEGIFGKEFYVNSFHHQVIATLGENVEDIGWATDGIIESIRLTNHKFALGVQWHPEMLISEDNKMLLLFKYLINASYICSQN